MAVSRALQERHSLDVANKGTKQHPSGHRLANIYGQLQENPLAEVNPRSVTYTGVGGSDWIRLEWHRRHRPGINGSTSALCLGKEYSGSPVQRTTEASVVDINNRTVPSHMFTGIIEEVGTVRRVSAESGGRRLELGCSFGEELDVDESVSVNGVCLTVVAQESGSFTAFAIEETLDRSTLGKLELGSAVNLERAMRATGRIDGHIVQGHVDDVARVTSVHERGSSHEFSLAIDPVHNTYVIPKGSITLDGISLTVVEASDAAVVVAIIPHTYQNTAISRWEVGSSVNVEFDVIGKYVVRYLEKATGSGAGAKSSRISEDWLKDQGF